MTRKVGTVDYEVDMHDKSIQKRIFHSKMLKPLYTPKGATYAMMATNDKEEYGGNDIQQPFDGNEGKPLVNEALPIHQQEQMRNLLEEGNDVLNSALVELNWSSTNWCCTYKANKTATISSSVGT